MILLFRSTLDVGKSFYFELAIPPQIFDNKRMEIVLRERTSNTDT